MATENDPFDDLFIKDKPGRPRKTKIVSGRKPAKALVNSECMVCHKPAKGQGARYPSGKWHNKKQLFYVICGICNRAGNTFDKTGAVIHRPRSRVTFVRGGW